MVQQKMRQTRPILMAEGFRLKANGVVIGFRLRVTLPYTSAGIEKEPHNESLAAQPLQSE